MSPIISSFNQVKGDFSTFKLHTSLTDSFPVFPPKTNKCGFIKTKECPYLLPGVDPTTGTIIQLPWSSPFRRSSK